jgi:glycosyltransferase involved in cell wall biosynthesis
MVFSTLYPNVVQPAHGIFVETRLRHLLAGGEVEATVVAPVPYFPSGSRHFGLWSRYAEVPPRETRHGIEILHPRYPVIPRIGMTLAPLLLAAAVRPVLRRLAATRRFDAIDAHYFYPDGVAAVWLGRRLGLPVVVTARGSDITQLPDYAAPRRMIRGAIAGAAGIVTVSAALRQAVIALGAPPEKVRVLRNGVDTTLFHPPDDRDAARAALGLRGPTLLSVGHLIPRKAHGRIIDALTELPGLDLLIVGEGPERAALQAQVARLGLGDRVRLLGPRPQTELPALYGAADALVLASLREGWANVLLESMACGTPVIASDIPGNPEVVQSRDAGLIARDGIAAALRDLFADPPSRAATRAYAERFSWDATSAGQLALFRQLAAGGPDTPARLRQPELAT